MTAFFNVNSARRIVYFSVIGGIAALVHILAVLLFVNFGKLTPLSANVFAFFIAFNVSYFGHKSLTFSKLESRKQLRLPHFFVVALSAGLINESLYYLLLHQTSLNYLVALIFVLGLVSVYSFILSRFWACR